jgi:hypothetical protein
VGRGENGAAFLWWGLWNKTWSGRPTRRTRYGSGGGEISGADAIEVIGQASRETARRETHDGEFGIPKDSGKERISHESRQRTEGVWVVSESECGRVDGGKTCFHVGYNSGDLRWSRGTVMRERFRDLVITCIATIVVGVDLGYVSCNRIISERRGREVVSEGAV